MNNLLQGGQAIALFQKTIGYLLIIAIALLALSCASIGTLKEAKKLTVQARRLNAAGKYKEALPLANRSLAIRKAHLGNEHRVIAISLFTLAKTYSGLGDYSKAESLYKQSLAIREKVLGPDHPAVARVLSNLAVLYSSSGDYDKAETLSKRSLAILEKALGPDDPKVAIALNNLAQPYKFQGNYAKAEPLLKRSLSILEKSLGPEDPKVALSLHNLAKLYQILGDYAKAEPLFKRSLAIWRKSLGQDHPRVALSLNNLAILYRFLGDYAKAEPLFIQSLAIREKAHGRDHPDVAQSLNDMARLYRDLGDFTKTESLLKRALTIREKTLGPDSPRLAGSLYSLAQVYTDLGDYDKAEPLHKRALAIREKTLGPDHPDVAKSLNNMAFLYAGVNDFQKAYNLMKKAQRIDDRFIDQVIGFTAQDQQLKFLSTRKRFLHKFMSLVDQYFADRSSAVKDALDVWLKRKGVVLEAQKRFQEALVQSDDTETIKTFQELSAVRSRISRLAFAGPTEKGFEDYKGKISSLKQKKEELEARLSKLSQAFALKKEVEKADSDKISKALSPNKVLVEFSKIKTFKFKAKGKEKKWNPPRYLAFVLRAGKGDKIDLVDLGDAGKIDRAVLDFRTKVTDSNDKKGGSAIETSREIYDLVFGPIRKKFENAKEVFISPDGNLNLIPFEVLQAPDGRYLIEDYNFNYLAAGRDIFRFGQIKEKGQKVVLMGDPDFDAVPGGRGTPFPSPSSAYAKGEKVRDQSIDMKGLHFKRLPGTKEEVYAIQALYGEDRTDLYTGSRAKEDVLRRLRSPSILHLATHGFFLEDLDVGGFTDDPSLRGLKKVSRPQKTGVKKFKFKNPLLRSGLALAGANNAIKSGDVEKSDGIVTAEKILGLRLRGTDMVVLSACETAMGKIKSGEGVFGLRRAFAQAGAKSLVMSMWSVPDKETKELMIDFYENIQSGKMSRSQALRQAALKEMKIVKERYGHSNPFLWGAFVFMGEP